MKDRANDGIGAAGQAKNWNDIPWRDVQKRVTNLRQRIFRATREQKWNEVRSLMKLMLRSRSNLLVSVRRVTQDNKGKATAGVDHETVLTPEGRMALVRKMSRYSIWKSKPTRRVYIPKAGGKSRPLGIPTIIDRVAQAVMKNALEPCWEARFESNSYGFRPGRSCHDAIKHCWILLKGNGLRPWVLDADIKGAFDNISHDYILNAIGALPGRELIKQWLKAGYVEQEMLHATEAGTPQGGVVSPLLANIALDGMQQMLGSKYGFVRYADDFIVCARTRAEAEFAQHEIQSWLAQRGLTLHPEKTRVVHVDDGFNFLGFTVRRYQGKCLFTPQKEKVLELVASIRAWLKRHAQVKQDAVILHLNPILTGWANYYRHGVSKRVFGFVDSEIWKSIWKWCLRRHPNKSQRWVYDRYFGEIDGVRWTFRVRYLDKDDHLRTIALRRAQDVRIERHIKIAGDASPDNPEQRDYWLQRRSLRGSTIRRGTILLDLEDEGLS
ncbi:MAG TPA: group II intron reverse transcriptase/maturase [Candidatus Obscuribacterales bacterium]